MYMVCTHKFVCERQTLYRYDFATHNVYQTHSLNNNRFHDVRPHSTTYAVTNTFHFISNDEVSSTDLPAGCLPPRDAGSIVENVPLDQSPRVVVIIWTGDLFHFRFSVAPQNTRDRRSVWERRETRPKRTSDSRAPRIERKHDKCHPSTGALETPWRRTMTVNNHTATTVLTTAFVDSNFEHGPDDYDGLDLDISFE